MISLGRLIYCVSILVIISIPCLPHALEYMHNTNIVDIANFAVTYTIFRILLLRSGTLQNVSIILWHQVKTTTIASCVEVIVHESQVLRPH